MIFNWIEIRNFGSYRDTTKVDLQPEKNKVVTLIGGKNGAGKSTFLEAIKCCLYGRRSRGVRARNVEFMEYLKKRRNYLQTEDEPSSIEVSFTFMNRGEEETYRVKRAWRLEDDNIIHSFRILKNGFRFSSVDEDEWQDYILDLIPPYILDLYLFDAEDMQSLAINDGDNQFLGHSLKMMLGLHYSEQLIKDLDLQLTRLSDGEETEVEKEFKEVKSKIEKLERRKESITQKLGSLRKDRDLAKKRLTKIEESFRAKGGQFAKQRDQNKEEKKEVKEQMQKVQGQLQQLAQGHLPFLIVKDRLQTLSDRLQNEREYQTISEVENMIMKRIDNLRQQDPSSQKSEKLETILDDLKTEFDTTKSTSLMRKLSIKDLGVLESIIDGLDEVQKDATRVISRGQDLDDQLSRINRQLNLAPDDDDTEVQDMFGQLEQQISKVKGFENNIEELSEEFNSVSYEQEQLNSELEKLRLKLRSIDKDKTVRDRIITAQQVLAKFIKKEKEVKIKELSEQIRENYAKICRKGQAVSNVDIDPETYTIRLYGPNNETWSKDFLSVGERQLLALSVLWSLANVSDRDLPFIIDTPLGKLDEEHRQGLVDDFFAVASSQVVILSTNKEIDSQLFDDLKPHISQSYLISFDNRRQSTLLESGYFFN